jgi:hypothetical protein
VRILASMRLPCGEDFFGKALQYCSLVREMLMKMFKITRRLVVFLEVSSIYRSKMYYFVFLVWSGERVYWSRRMGDRQDRQSKPSDCRIDRCDLA